MRLLPILKKGLLTSFFATAFATMQAQILVGSAEVPTLNRTGSLSSSDLARLRATTTLFVMPDADLPNVAVFEEAIRKVWKVTPFRVIGYDDMGTYMQEGKYSFFLFSGYVISRNNGGGNTHLTYDLVMPTFNRKGEPKGWDYFSRTMIYPDIKTMMFTTMDFGYYTSTRKSRREGMGRLYAEGNFYDWGPGYLMGKLRFINDKLLAGETSGVFSEVENKEALAALTRDTLLIPDYVNVQMNPITGERVEGRLTPAEISETYPYPFRVVSSEELEARILKADKPVYYLLYTMSSADKFINVFSTTGGRLYSEYTPVSYQFKAKDLKKLAKALRK